MHAAEQTWDNGRRAPQPPIPPVLNLLAAGPQTAAYLYAHSGLGTQTGTAIARAVREGAAVKLPDNTFALLPGARVFLRDPEAIAAYLRSICPECGPAVSCPGDDRRIKLALLIGD